MRHVFCDYISVVLYVTNIVGGAAIGGAPPLLYELVCESTFPIAEGITNLFMTCLNNMAGLIFLLIPLFVTGTVLLSIIRLSKTYSPLAVVSFHS